MTGEVLANGPFHSGCCVIHHGLGRMVKVRATSADEAGQPAGRTAAGTLGRGAAGTAGTAGTAGAVPSQGQGRPADLLVLGDMLTMDPQRPTATAMAVSGGRILALGSETELEGLRGPATEVLALGDQVVLPGLVEPHMHLWSTAVFDAWTDCSASANPTFGAVVERIGRAAAAAAPGEWVTGKSFDPSLYPGEPDLTAAILDRAAPSNPVLVANASMHFVYANSAALALAHITDQTPDPPGGRYLRANGALTGVVSEGPAMMPLLSAVPQLSHEQLLDGLAGILGRAASQGITKVHEAATGALFGASELGILHGLAAAGRLPARVTTAQFDAARAAFEQAGPRPGDGDDMVRAVSWKAISDGSNQGRSGYQREPYLGSADRGAANCSQDELAEVVRYAHDRGWQLMVHANGDAALDLTVAAYAKALAGAPASDLRHRIEHCSIADDGHFRAMAELGISPSFLMNHVHYWGSALRDSILGPQRADRLDAAASALRHGLRPSFHSDYSVSPMSPLLAVQTAVTRRTRDGSVLNAAEGIDLMSALRAVTIDAAWQTHCDDVTGSLTPGKYADFVVLAQDPRQADPAAIGAIAVRQTRLAGVVTWDAPA